MNSQTCRRKSISITLSHPPTHHKQAWVAAGAVQAFLQGGHERVAPGFDFVLHGKDVLLESNAGIKERLHDLCGNKVLECSLESCRITWSEARCSQDWRAFFLADPSAIQCRPDSVDRPRAPTSRIACATPEHVPGVTSTFGYALDHGLGAQWATRGLGGWSGGIGKRSGSLCGR